MSFSQGNLLQNGLQDRNYPRCLLLKSVLIIELSLINLLPPRVPVFLNLILKQSIHTSSSSFCSMLSSIHSFDPHRGEIVLDEHDLGTVSNLSGQLSSSEDGTELSVTLLELPSVSANL